MSKLRLEGKVALITGAASGIGEATARLFAEHGASVIIADIQDALGERVASSIPNASYFHCDVRQESDVSSAVAFAVEKHGALDVLFSNAAVLGPFSGVLDLDLAALDATFATNVRGVAATLKHGGRAMIAGGVRGSIICTASISATVAGPALVAYAAAKHAVLGLVKAGCAELGEHGIRVNCVSPFGVATPMVCNAYGMGAEEIEERTMERGNLKGLRLKAKNIADAALFLASDESVYISGHNLVVDGGFTVVADGTKSQSTKTSWNKELQNPSECIVDSGDRKPPLN